MSHSLWLTGAAGREKDKRGRIGPRPWQFGRRTLDAHQRLQPGKLTIVGTVTDAAQRKLRNPFADPEHVVPLGVRDQHRCTADLQSMIDLGAGIDS